MDFIVDFYKNLDTINLILFWGIIIVVILLLVFSIILAYKNKKLKEMLNSKIQDEQNNKRDIPILLPNENKIEKVNTIEEKEVEKPKVEEEHKFVAEEHVIEYNKDLFRLNNINKVEDYTEEKKEYITQQNTKTEPYQRNVLREMSSSQTSPIGIVKIENNEQKEIAKASELNEMLNKDTMDTLPDISNNTDITRTAYEIKEEEDAIISYEELMQKKDSIQTIDEEDAVISIGELIEKKKQEERLYNITKNEENNEFIKELKDFRDDL